MKIHGMGQMKEHMKNAPNEKLFKKKRKRKKQKPKLTSNSSQKEALALPKNETT